MADYEESDATPGPVLAFGLGVVLLVGALAMAVSYLHAAWRQPAGPLSQPTPLQLQATDPDPGELHRYQWIDRSQGLVQIPIEEAMEVVSQGGVRASNLGHRIIPDSARPADGRDRSPVPTAPGGPASGPEPGR